LSKLSTLTFTCVLKIVACSHIRSHLWTLLSISKKNLAAENLPSAISLQKLFLLCLMWCRSCLRGWCRHF
jgi:hypothetical protein